MTHLSPCGRPSLLLTSLNLPVGVERGSETWALWRLEHPFSLVRLSLLSFCHFLSFSFRHGISWPHAPLSACRLFPLVLLPHLRPQPNDTFFSTFPLPTVFLQSTPDLALDYFTPEKNQLLLLLPEPSLCSPATAGTLLTLSPPPPRSGFAILLPAPPKLKPPGPETDEFGEPRPRVETLAISRRSLTAASWASNLCHKGVSLCLFGKLPACCVSLQGMGRRGKWSKKG